MKQSRIVYYLHKYHKDDPPTLNPKCKVGTATAEEIMETSFDMLPELHLFCHFPRGTDTTVQIGKLQCQRLVTQLKLQGYAEDEVLT